MVRPDDATAADNFAPAPDPHGADGEATDFPEENPNRPREYHGGRTLIVALLVLGAVALALWVASSSRDAPTGAGDFGVAALPPYLNPQGVPVDDAVGSLAPDFELETLDGERFRLSDWRGHPVLLNLWASWCTPCRREVPVLIRLQDQFRAQGLVIVGVNIEEARSPARGFAEEFGINYVIPMDFSGDVTRRYGVVGQVGPPHTYFIGPDGTIEMIFRGQAPDDIFVETVTAFVEGLPEAVGERVLPGPKALPTALVGIEQVVAPSVGALAPDFVLERAADSAAPSWRLSDQRGAALLLIFAAPACTNCDELVASAASAARRRGIEPVVIAAEDAAGRYAAHYTTLRWDAETARLFSVDDARFVLVDAQGVIDAIPSSDGPLAAALDALAVRTATATRDAEEEPS